MAPNRRRSIQVTYSDDKGLVDIRTGEPVKDKEICIVARRMRHFRLQREMEQKELGKYLGISGNTISNWENGKGRPDISLLPKICRALGINLYQLFGMDNEANTFTLREVTLVTDYRSLSDGHKFTVDGVVKSLKAVEMAERCRNITELIFCSHSLAAGIGDPSEFEDDSEPIYLYSSDIIDRADYVFEVNGDSMEPEYHNGDMVLVEKTTDLDEGEVGAFMIGNEAYIKIRKKDGLYSFNKDYKPMRFNESEQVILIGRVLGIIEPESDIADDDDVETYFSIRARRGED